MILRIVKAKPIKPGLVRFDIEVWDNNHIQGEYSIAELIEPYITYPGEDSNEVKFDVVALQQSITNTCATLQFFGLIASNLVNMEWDVFANDTNKVEQKD